MATRTCQGVLGFTLFEDYLLTLDFPAHRMLLTRGEIRGDSGGSVLPFRMPDGVPIVALKIGDQQLEAQIDSGGTGLSVPQKDSRELKFQETPEAFATGESVSTKFEIKAARLQTDVRLGRYTFKQAFVEISSVFPLVNIGSTPLQTFHHHIRPGQRVGALVFEAKTRCVLMRRRRRRNCSTSNHGSNRITSWCRWGERQLSGVSVQ